MYCICMWMMDIDVQENDDDVDDNKKKNLADLRRMAELARSNDERRKDKSACGTT